MNIRCQKCGVTNSPEKRRCGACGQPIMQMQSAPTAQGAQGKPLATSPSYAQPRVSRSPLTPGASDGRRALTPQGSAPRPAGQSAGPSAPISPRPVSHPLPSAPTPRLAGATPEEPLEPSAGRPPLTYERLLKLTREGDGLALFVFDPPATESAAPPPKHLSALLELTAPRAVSSAEEASLCLCLELPPRSWLQAIAALKPDLEVWIWLPRWPEGKTGSQLTEGFPCALYFADEGLAELGAALLRLCPELNADLPREPWWAEARSRAALQEAEASYALLAATAGASAGAGAPPPYAVPLCARRARSWAQASGAPPWAQLAQALHLLAESLGAEAAGGGPSWAQAPSGQAARAPRALAALQCAERVTLHELSSRPLALPALRVACLTALQADAPVVPPLLERLGQQLLWFKHPQAMLNKMGVEQTHWCVLSSRNGIWDGGDLISAVRGASPHTKVALCLPDPSVAELTRAQHLKVDLLLDLRLGEAAAHLALTRALAAQGGGGDREALLKRLGAIGAAQEAQGRPAQGGLLLLRLPGGAPWLPTHIATLEALRARHLPKSLPTHPLAEDTVGVCLAERDEEGARAFVAQSLLALGTRHAAGGALYAGASAPEATLLDAVTRLEWARASGEGVSIGSWRGEHKAPGARLRGAQVIIVDTDPTSADALRFACEREGLLVTSLTSTKAALDLIARLPQPPQLVLAECAPPQSDGLALLKACAQLGRGAPRVVLSAGPQRDGLMSEAFELGATDFITKPLQVSEALARLLYALRRP